MKLSPLALAGAMLFAGCLPANAADAAGTARQAALVPVKLTAFAAGAVVGTPIAVVRKVAANTASTTRQVAGDGNKLMLPVAGLVGLPVGIFTGSVEGLYWGVANSWLNSSEKPFGKESFSLGELKD